ncbi:MAG: tRNA pseudouridine(54/55) synthase Pus10, partial [bacterium]
GLFDRLEHMTGIVERSLGTLEYRTFLVGTRVPAEVHEREAVVVAASGSEHAEPVNTELNREIGRRLVERHGWVVEFKRPDVTTILDARFDHVTLNARPLFVYGRYRKLSRDVPQTHWPCRRCKGAGCNACGLTGRQYETSVEELVAAPAVRAAEAQGATFHGAGREDVDARCLGTGRPFVLELAEPRVRALDLAALQSAINEHAAPHAEVEGLSWTEREAVERVKAATGGKAYEADVSFDEAVPAERLLTVCRMLSPARVAQRTPSRVSHRRADKVRPRTVAEVRVLSHEGTGARLRIEGDAGLYIKELIGGDEGRTEPSLAGLLGVGARCVALDVVHVDPPPGVASATE